MASLLDRISAAPGSGPVRNNSKGNRAGATSPYVRQHLALVRPSLSSPSASLYNRNVELCLLQR